MLFIFGTSVFKQFQQIFFVEFDIYYTTQISNANIRKSFSSIHKKSEYILGAIKQFWRLFLILINLLKS